MAPGKKAKVLPSEEINSDAANTKELSLEEAFSKLEEVMGRLEKSDISLEESFALYQQGMNLLKQCNDSIDRVEKKLMILEEEGI